MKWFYLSFASEDSFLGACVVRAESVAGAITKSHLLGINPGGEVLAIESPMGDGSGFDKADEEVFLTPDIMFSKYGGATLEELDFGDSGKPPGSDIVDESENIPAVN